MRRLLSLTIWALREPTYWRVSILVFLVLVFSLASGVILAIGETPEAVVTNSLQLTVRLVVRTAYPLLFPLVAVLATLAIVVQRESGGFATLQALGFHRWEILVGQTLAVLLLTWTPAVAAVLLLPPLIEPGLLARANLAALYPLGFWSSLPRLLLVILFLTLVAAAFSMVVRRAAIAFGAMITFFFVGWSLASSLGPYALLAPHFAFSVAYSFFLPLPGILIDPNQTFLVYLGVAGAMFSSSLLYADRRGDVA